jgi:hypothetical protein
MYDCDTAFCADISSWIGGDSVRARVASAGGLPPDRWQKLFESAGLPLPASRVKALFTDEETLPNYCSGCYIVPRPILQKLREVWPRWDRWLLDRPDLISPYNLFADQIAFTMSCEELGLSVDYFPLELNLDCKNIPRGRLSIWPLVLHYHRLNKRGFLRLTKSPSVNQQVRKINNLIRLAKRINFCKSSLLLLRGRRTA